MPVGRVVTPFLLSRGGNGLYYHFGVGEFMFDQGEAHNAYIRAHLANGRCENDAVPLTNPGKCTLLTVPPASTWSPPQ